MSAAPGMLTCIVCDSAFDTAANDEHFDTVPHAGTLFYSSGHYGSTVFDPFDSTKLEIIVCDKCLAERSGRVALVAPPVQRQWHRFAWEAPASGIETEGHDPAEGHGAKHESPTDGVDNVEGIGDAQPKGYSGSVKL